METQQEFIDTLCRLAKEYDTLRRDRRHADDESLDDAIDAILDQTMDAAQGLRDLINPDRAPHTHTPGPWTLQRLSTNWHGWPNWSTFCVRSSGGNNCLAVVGEVDRATDDNNEANAILMVAAPELLAALQKIDANAAESVDWIRRIAREAIAKATGG